MTAAALHLVRTPDRPGPGSMPDAVLRAMDVVVRRRVDSMLAGDHRSALLGRGTELAQIRAYVPGDDIRRMDWNVTARTRIPHVRVDLAERSLLVWLALDTSLSMAFGTADRRKADVAEGVALSLGHIASRRSNRLGVMTFGDDAPRVLPPRQGRPALFGLLNVLSAGIGDGRPAAGLQEALTKVAALARQRALVVIVSDFMGPRDWQPALTRLASRHDVIAVEIGDPREQALPDAGELWLVDPETGEHLRVNTGSRRLRERFAAAASQEQDARAAIFKAAGVSHVRLSTEGDWLRGFVQFVKQRKVAR